MSSVKYQRTIILSVVWVLMVSGCNSFSLLPESKKIDYKSAGKIPPLEVPPDLTTPSADDRYVVPDVSSTGSATFSTYNREREEQPQTYSSSSILPGAKSGSAVHIARSGTQRWLVVRQAPEDVWPIVKEFWQDLGFLVKVEAPDVGVMETDWAENRAKIPQDIIRSVLSTFLDSLYSTAERDKFRTRLERSESGETEIYISHRGMYEAFAERSTNRTVWQPRPADPDLEAEMLARLMIRFGAGEELARQEVASAANGAGTVREQAYMDKMRGGVLIINEAFDRAWRRVGLALDRVGFTVEDRDRANGVYFVRYADPDLESRKASEGEGILSKLAFWRSNADSKAERYRIQVSGVGVNSEVKVLYEDGTQDESGATNRILTLLYEQLK
ncbi:outer membrane protein assembly factor BamC [Nitrosomonas sp. Nm33]|uniref:outer membrane protein assembly factor BamC n=1 Tax=Nitrosomonas sp. Nm33 TaxID=133724 RepID=UPI00089B6194|nr:outer membrane protein assembly factor BamC [Nitrosomonas sp. Nm33]SDY93736.1 outer membrane protein assembly factor BamC [Nitrosomonas sp. Nm33]